MAHHLAQINISPLLAPLDDPKIAEFVAKLEPINALADKAPGFVWRLTSESGNATDIVYNDDPFVIVNMSVWESIAALRDFAYKSNHAKVFRSGSKRWTSPATASGGSQLATSPSSPKVVSGWNTIRNMAQSHTRSGFPSTSPSPLMKVSARSLTERPLHPVTKRAANAKIGP